MDFIREEPFDIWKISLLGKLSQTLVRQLHALTLIGTSERDRLAGVHQAGALTRIPQHPLARGPLDGNDYRRVQVMPAVGAHLDQAVRWIEGKLSALVKIGESTKREIAMVGEYRTRLIADVVTGKLDVREAAAGLPAVDFLAADDTLDGGNAPDDVSDSESEVATSGRDGFGKSPAALSEAV